MSDTKKDQWEKLQREHPSIADFMKRFSEHAQKTYGIKKSFTGFIITRKAA